MKTNNKKDNFEEISKAFDTEDRKEKLENRKDGVDTPDSNKNLSKTKIVKTNKAKSMADFERISKIFAKDDKKGRNLEKIKENDQVRFKRDTAVIGINREGRKLERKAENVKSDWGNVSASYDKYLVSDGSYHADVIMPNLFRMIGDVSGKENNKNLIKKNSASKNILDIACGQGQIASELLKLGGKVEAFDYGIDLIKIAKENAKRDKADINYLVADAQDFAKNYTGQIFDIVVCVLAIQNIENIKLVLENIKKVTDNNSKIYFVINHPSYRIPKSTEWGYTQEGSGNDNKSIQYRRVDKYMSEEKIKMDMNPGQKIETFKDYTYSYHRPLQYYFKLFSNNNFAVTRLEEWISNRVSDGKHGDRENTARKEFPMFMCLEVKNI